jgi:predicted Co/Zn/Cd cation transporter (cation efflux family)
VGDILSHGGWVVESLFVLHESWIAGVQSLFGLLDGLEDVGSILDGGRGVSSSFGSCGKKL